MECVVCGESFQAQRATALYCSGKCRKRAQREPPAQTRPASGLTQQSAATEKSAAADLSPEPPSPLPLRERLKEIGERRHAAHRDGYFDSEPPGPGEWEWSQAYGWVPREPPSTSYDIRTGIVVTEAGESRESVQDGWYGPAD